jgi:hypothetical protein
VGDVGEEPDALMQFRLRGITIIESVRACARRPLAGLAHSCFELFDAVVGERWKAQLRVVSSAVSRVGESQRDADFVSSFSLGHKDFAARIQVTS